MGLKKLGKKMGTINAFDEKPACFICGSTENLTKTECCGHWICDDESEYVPFSYQSNSCYRNHRKYTLCGHHHAEEHKGHWKNCKKCKDDFKNQMELYVDFGTNEYNYETLDKIPEVKPTYCSKCNRKINLTQDVYAMQGGKYICEFCTDTPLPFSLKDPSGLKYLQSEEVFSEDYDDDDYDNNEYFGEDRPARLSYTNVDMVPQKSLYRFEELYDMLDQFGEKVSGMEFAFACMDLMVSLCVQYPDEICRGNAKGWAAGIVHALGIVNFLNDKSLETHVPVSDMYGFFGASNSTMLSRSKFIRDEFGMFPMDPLWSMPSVMLENPLLWTVEIDGIMVDLSQKSEEEQKKAVAKGLIPMTYNELKSKVYEQLAKINEMCEQERAEFEAENETIIESEDRSSTIKFTDHQKKK